jgi:glycosyltransferase involved in cell wall biosynthesis
LSVTPRLWCDVEDLFEFARANPRPSGIQRVAFELYRTLQEQYGASGLVHFLRHDTGRGGFRSVSWHEIADLFADLTTQERRQQVRLDPIRPRGPAVRAVRRLVHRLPPELRVSILEAIQAQVIAGHTWVRFFIAAAKWMSQLATSLLPRKGAIDVGHDNFADMAVPGDFLLALGAPWAHPDYSSLVRSQCGERGLRFVLLAYDLIPVRHPEWCKRGLVRVFRAWIDSVLPLCTSLFAISHATAADVANYACERGFVLPPIISLPMGTSFGHEQIEARRTTRLPSPGTYALFVSTIEARKNHTLLFRVWQRLLMELPDTEVPKLVFAGRVGWLVDDLMLQIANTDNLQGHLLIVEDPTDAELALLYRGCLFTLFPSFYEGWGLPVAESLAFGKPCLIADQTALPEVGGSLARQFDPYNLHDAYTEIKDVVEDRAGLARWEARVREEFRPVSWSTTVDALLIGLGHPLGSQPAARSNAMEQAAKS